MPATSRLFYREILSLWIGYYSRWKAFSRKSFVFFPPSLSIWSRSYRHGTGRFLLLVPAFPWVSVKPTVPKLNCQITCVMRSSLISTNHMTSQQSRIVFRRHRVHSQIATGQLRHPTFMLPNFETLLYSKLESIGCAFQILVSLIMQYFIHLLIGVIKNWWTVNRWNGVQPWCFWNPDIFTS